MTTLNVVRLSLRSSTPVPLLFPRPQPLHILPQVGFGIHAISLRAKHYRCNSGRQKYTSSAVDKDRKLILEVKERLEREHGNLPIGKNGRDDEEMILWFLKDRKFDVDDTASKLANAIAWRKEFGVDNLTAESIQNMASTGKAYLHKFPDVTGRPVVVVVAAKHLPSKHDLLESEKLCVYLLEKALSQLPPGEEKILGIFDLRGFTLQNGDLTFIKFLIDVFYNYYPKRIGQALFVDAPLIFQPGWNIVKPWLKSYANLDKFSTRLHILAHALNPKQGRMKRKALHKDKLMSIRVKKTIQKFFCICSKGYTSLELVQRVCF